MFEMKPSRIKNLWITAWCLTCKKPKSYSGTLMIGGFADNDPEAVPVPEMCTCAFWQTTYPAVIPGMANLTVNMGDVMISIQSSPVEDEHEQLQRALRIVQAVAACEGCQENWISFCNPENKEDVAQQYVTDALALLHEVGWL